MQPDPHAFYGILGVPLISLLVESVKQMFPNLPGRFYPGVSILIGIILNLSLAYIIKVDYPTSAFVGLVAGLAASGLYSGIKAIRGPTGMNAGKANPQ